MPDCKAVNLSIRSDQLYKCVVRQLRITSLSAGLMYVKDGFIDFIDRNTAIGTSTYGKSLTP